MLRMTAVTLGGLFASFLIFGGELSQDEKAELDTVRANRTSVTAVLSEAFNPSPNRQGAYVPPLKEMHSTQRVEQPVLARSAAQNTAAITQAALTIVSDTDKLSALADTAQSTTDIILRSVTATRVNVRSGPSTNNAVLGQVVQAEIVRVISDPSQDWVKIAVEGDGVEGYMASRFLARAE